MPSVGEDSSGVCILTSGVDVNIDVDATVSIGTVVVAGVQATKRNVNSEMVITLFLFIVCLFLQGTA